MHNKTTFHNVGRWQKTSFLRVKFSFCFSRSVKLKSIFNPRQTSILIAFFSYQHLRQHSRAGTKMSSRVTRPLIFVGVTGRR